MKCERCEREELEGEEDVLDLRRPGKLQRRETTIVVSDRERGHYCHFCRSEEQIYSGQKIFKVLKKHGLVDGMNNVRVSELPEDQSIQETVSQLEEDEE